MYLALCTAYDIGNGHCYISPIRWVKIFNLKYTPVTSLYIFYMVSDTAKCLISRIYPILFCINITQISLVRRVYEKPQHLTVNYCLNILPTYRSLFSIVHFIYY